MTQRPPLFGATSEAGSPTPEMLANVTNFLAGRKLYGLVWCDAELVSTHCYGKLAGFIPLGVNICQGGLPLMGFDEQILALRRLPDTSVVLPDISFRYAGGTTPKININVYWLPGDRQFLVVVSRVQKDLVQELTRQIRARRMSDGLLAEKSRQLDQANRELTRANADLEEFAYVISHDLNAPLRALRYLSSDLEQSLAGVDVPAAAVQLAQLKTQTQRMSAMLTGLFEYASLGRKDEAVAQVDTAELISQIIASLPAHRQIRIVTSGDWPVLTTVDQPLDLVLRNLIENAVKHHDRDDGLVEVNACEADNGWQFSITDDGPGIPPDYREAIFRPFLKVDDDASPESSGVGLAIVKKTVEGLGGRIEILARTDGNRGSIFQIFWPRTIET